MIDQNYIRILNNHRLNTPLVPPRGFILQKDVYNTNLLYAYNQFPLYSLRKNLPFRPTKLPEPDNPGHGIQILRENGKISTNGEEEKNFYSLNSFKPKKFGHQKLKFPLPKIKTIPLTNSVLYKEICDKNIKIQYMEDDNNISTKDGKKIIYNLKEKNLPVSVSTSIDLPSVDQNNINNYNTNTFNMSGIEHPPKVNPNNIFTHLIKNKRYCKIRNNSCDLNGNDIKNSLPMRSVICELNNNLKIIDKEDKERKRSFIKDNVFATQINSNISGSLHLAPLQYNKI